MKRRILIILSMMVLAGAAAAVTAIVVIKDEVERGRILPEPVSIQIPPGQGLRTIAARLREAGLITSERIFLGMALYTGVDRAIKHGRHEFEGRVTLSAVLDELTRPPKPFLRVTIPEGLTLWEIAALLEKAGAVPAAGYVAVACSAEFRNLVGAPAEAECGEGYLFPDTYDLLPGMSPGSMVDLQARRFREVIEPLIAQADPTPDSAGQDSDKPAPDTKRSPPSGPDRAGADPTGDGETHQQRVARLLTLASIVEKETGQASERPRIAAVFFNRLRFNMPLQTDPTVIYGVIASGQPWDGNLTRAHLDTPTPYNTYRIKGLPPGPICNPGRAAVAAVLDPADTADLYFVARGDGSHQFSPNLAEHNRAVRRYQLR